MLTRMGISGGTGARTRARGAWGIGLAVLIAGLLTAFSAASASALTDLSGGAYQILAPGAEGGLYPGPFSSDQAALYDALTPLGGHVGQAKLEEDYVSEKFGVQGAVLRTEEPEAGLKIERDSHDIPHVFGATRNDVMFGSGWLAAQDRGLLL